jgi:hypothetical protein
LPLTSLVAVTVSSTVKDSTGSWISDLASAARAFTRSSRNESIASASPRALDPHSAAVPEASSSTPMPVYIPSTRRRLGRSDIGSLPVVEGCVLGPLCSPWLGRGWTKSQATAPVRGIDGPEDDPPSLIASQQGMGSLDSGRVIEHHGDQRFRWSERTRSPPPESNRRPHPYHSCGPSPTEGLAQVSVT